MLNRAWRRYGWINSAGLAAIVAGWAGARVNEAKPSSLSGRERQLALAKDAAVAAELPAPAGAAATPEVVLRRWFPRRC